MYELSVNNDGLYTTVSLIENGDVVRELPLRPEQVSGLIRALLCEEARLVNRRQIRRRQQAENNADLTIEAIDIGFKQTSGNNHITATLQVGDCGLAFDLPLYAIWHAYDQFLKVMLDDTDGLDRSSSEDIH